MLVAQALHRRWLFLAIEFPFEFAFLEEGLDPSETVFRFIFYFLFAGNRRRWI